MIGSRSTTFDNTSTGETGLGNGDNGVNLSRSGGNAIGGTKAGAENVISANGGIGVSIFSGGENRIEGNFIGTDVTGAEDLGNTGDGVFIDRATRNTVGGATSGTRNKISHNGGGGVHLSGDNIFPTTDTRILRNSISDNDALGIDLAGGTENQNSVTLNDPDDADTEDDGANRLQNFPVITSATTISGTTTIQGTLNSTPDDTFNLQFFSNSAADPSGFGEGKTFVGQTNVVTNVGGNTTFSLTTTAPVSGGEVITATATNTITNDTSEFSEAVEVEDNTPPPPPAPQCDDGADNDGDTLTDFPDDPGCESAGDDSESPDPAVPACTITGSPGNDTLPGTNGNDVICGLGGNDTIRGLGGDDIVFGGSGKDTINGGDGNDTIEGGDGNDKITGASDDDTLKGGSGKDNLTGNSGADDLFGEADNDTLNTRDSVRGNDLADGGDGSDTCRTDVNDTRVSCP